MERKKITQQLKLTVLISVLLFFATIVQGADLISFALSTNYNSTSGLSSGTISTTATTYDPSFSGSYLQTKGWDSGTPGGFKSYETTAFSTFGYYNVVVNASIYSQSAGPRDFAVEYKIGAGGSWTQAGTFTVGTTAANKAISLPTECNNQSSVFVRWIATSYTSTSGGSVLAVARNYIYAASITGDLPAVPDNQATTIRFVSITPTTIRVSCTPGNGDNRIIVMNTTNNFTLPTDNYFPTANPVYTGGQQVVYNGSGSIITVTVPSSTNEYYFRVFDFKNNGGMTRYITSTAYDNPKLCALETITVNSATNIRLTRATLGATISPKKSTINDRGIVWSLTSGDNFTYTNEFSDYDTQDGAFSLNFPDNDFGTNNMPRGKTIYFKGYVENISGKIYSAESSFTNVPTFTGTGNWEDYTKWNVQEVPGANGDATYGSVEDSPIINGTCTLTASNNVTNLTINSGKKLTINKATEMKVDGTLTNNAGTSGILLKSIDDSSDASANATLIFANGNPQATVEMFSKASWNTSLPVGSKYKWQFFGIPFTSLSYNSAFNTSGCYVRKWAENSTDYYDAWVRDKDGVVLQLSSGATLSPGLGYELVQQNNKKYTLTGTLVHSDFYQTLPYTSTAYFKGESVLSNPYTAAMDISEMTFGANTEEAIYTYNTGTYNDWLSADGQHTPGTGPGTYTVTTKGAGGLTGILTQIPSMQGFIVKSTNAAGGSVSFPYASLIKNTEKQKAKAVSKTGTMIDLIGTHYSDRMWLLIDDNCSPAFDNGYDGRKVLGSELASQIYGIQNDEPFQIQALSDVNESYLGFLPGNDASFKLVFNHQNMDTKYSKLYLMDLVANKTVDITASGSEYLFTSESTDDVKRFKIVSATTALKNQNTVSGLSIYYNNNNIVITNNTNDNGELSIYDAMGRTLQVSKFSNNAEFIIPTNLSKGSYLVKAVVNSEKITKRIIIN